MRVFVLCTGRCGSVTFSKACSHITNFTVAHESGRKTGYDLGYPDNHIEVDNRLVWFAGRLHEKYPDAFYVHLTRDEEATAASYAARDLKKKSRILRAFALGIKQQRGRVDAMQEAREMVATMNANIREFLVDKHHVTIDIDEASTLFGEVWDCFDAQGDLDAALAEFSNRYNARRNWRPRRYHRVARRWIEQLGPGETIIDVGSRQSEMALCGQFNRRIAVEPGELPDHPEIEAVKSTWEEFEDPPQAKVITCLEVLEHLTDEEIRPFVDKLFAHAEHVIISVPWRWPKGRCANHVQDPINRKKFLDMIGHREVVKEKIVGRRSKRLVALVV